MRKSSLAIARRGGLWLMLLPACASAEAGSPTPPGPDADARSQALATLSAELSNVMPADSRIWMFAVGDADGDGDEEVAVVLSVDDAHQPRPLWLLRRDAGGRLQRVVESPRAIPCYECGGMTGDPLAGVQIEPGVVKLRFAGGSRELWESDVRFTYSAGQDVWRLTSVTHRGFDTVDGRNAERALSTEEIGEVSLASFDASEFPADALP